MPIGSRHQKWQRKNKKKSNHFPQGGAVVSATQNIDSIALEPEAAFGGQWSRSSSNNSLHSTSCYIFLTGYPQSMKSPEAFHSSL